MTGKRLAAHVAYLMAETDAYLGGPCLLRNAQLLRLESAMRLCAFHCRQLLFLCGNACQAAFVPVWQLPPTMRSYQVEKRNADIARVFFVSFCQWLLPRAWLDRDRFVYKSEWDS